MTKYRALYRGEGGRLVDERECMAQDARTAAGALGAPAGAASVEFWSGREQLFRIDLGDRRPHH